MKDPKRDETGIKFTYEVEMENLQKIIRKIPELSKFISDYDVHDFFNTRLPFVEKVSIPSIDYETLKKSIDRYFFSEPKVIDYYFRIARSGNFPEGFEVGTGNIISYNNLPEDVQKTLNEQYWKLFYEEDKFSWERKLEDYEERQKTYAYIHFSVKAIGSFKFNEKSFAEVKKNTNILKFVYGDSFFGEIISVPYLYCWKIGDNIGAHVSNFTPPAEFFRIEFLDDYIKEISKIIKKDKQDDIEQKISDAVEICGLIEHETPLRVRFLLKMTCLEALLLGKDDKDYLGWKLAEKISLLLGDSKVWMITFYKLNIKKGVDQEFIKDNKINARIGLEKAVKYLYEIRSDFAHGDIGDYEQNDLETQYHLLTSILSWITERLLGLHNSGITRVTKRTIDDKTALDYHIQTLKYAV